MTYHLAYVQVFHQKDQYIYIPREKKQKTVKTSLNSLAKSLLKTLNYPLGNVQVFSLERSKDLHCKGEEETSGHLQYPLLFKIPFHWAPR